MNKIFVERETYEKDGKTYFSYFINGNLRGKDFRILVQPPDKGGYAVLDIVYDSAMEAELVLVPYEIKAADGNVIKGNTYLVRTYDENGEAWECPVKPFRQSDKSLLNMLIAMS